MPDYGNVEVKWDVKSQETGNIAIEYLNNNGQPSGISITKADYWFHVLSDEILIIKVNRLREFLTINNILKNGTSEEGATSHLISIYQAKNLASQVLERRNHNG